MRSPALFTSAEPAIHLVPAEPPFQRLDHSPLSDLTVPLTVFSGQTLALSSSAPPESFTPFAKVFTSAPSGSGTSLTPKGLRAFSSDRNSALSTRNPRPMLAARTQERTCRVR